MKIKVVTLGDITKYLVKIGVIFGIIAILTNFFYDKRNSNYFSFNASEFLTAMKEEILLLKEDRDYNISFDADEYGIKTIQDEFNMFKAVATINPNSNINSNQISSNVEDTEENEEISAIDNSNMNESELEENKELELAETGLAVEVIPSNIPDKTSYEIYGVKLRNESDYNLQKEITNLDVEFNKQDIVIFHTHTCESYTPTEKYQYESTGNFRTTDLNYTVARVGDELDKYLTNYGYSVVHDKSYHDYPSYNGSYNRSLITVQNLLETYQNTDVVIDLHRDAIGDNTYAPKVKIGDEYCARLMFVIGTDGGGLKHDGWRQNLKFAMKVVQKGNELYPGLFKPIIVRNSRYNHNASKAACIIEVGATGNTLEECLNSMKYLAKIYNEI